MCRAMWANNSRAILLSLGCVAATLSAQPGDEAVESYLRARGMDSLLEVQLESRLQRAESEQDRGEIAEDLAGLYLETLRSLDADDPYRQVLMLRARALLNRVSVAPLYDLRLELLINDYNNHEQQVELYRLGLSSESNVTAARAVLTETARSLHAIMRAIEPEIDRAGRARARTMSAEEADKNASRLEALRRQHSLAAYYLGWCGYGLAVLEDRHVEDRTFIAFAWLLGQEGGLPQQNELSRAALEYEHVARSAIGIALSYAQSEDDSLAESWMNALLDDQSIPDPVRDAAELRKLQVLAMARNWYEVNTYAREISDADAAEYLPVAEARFITMRALDSRVSGPPGSGGEEQAIRVAKLGIEHLVDRGEIGHVVDLYQRYDDLPMLATGFIPNYARALAELNQLESSGRQVGYTDVARRFEIALKAPDADEYTQHREACRLKLAYALIRADRPAEAVEQCDRVLQASLLDDSLEEARWLKIAALDRQNAMADRASSPELDQAVRAYVEAYPGSSRTAKLVLRHAMRGTLDERIAIETLSTVPKDDPIAIPARRTLIQLQYQILRRTDFADTQLLRDTRSLIEWLIEEGISESADQDTARAHLTVLRIGIDLALRDEPTDALGARAMIERSHGLLQPGSSDDALRGELQLRSVQVAVQLGQIDQALSLIDDLRGTDPRKAEQAETLVLNALLVRWAEEPDIRSARLLLDFGLGVLERLTPDAPRRIGLQVSSITETLSRASAFLGEGQDDEKHRALALRLGKRVLGRGEPSEAGLRLTAELAAEQNDQDTELEAWLRLLAAYPQEDERWYEARYESLRVMLHLDPQRAQEAFEQFRVLNPSLGPPPWSQRFAELFSKPVPAPAGAGTPGPGGTP